MTTKKERAQIVLKYLNRHFPNPDIPLKHCDPYTLLIAVLLSAQCTDERVNKITPKLFEMACKPVEMIDLGRKKIEEIIKPCGLANRKSKAIFNLSKILLEKHKGQVPASFSKLEALPGVGHKTASVVMSQAFFIPAFPVDTHIHRLAQRWGLSKGKNVAQTETDLKKLFKKEDWNKLHLQFIFYGRKYCSAYGCDGTLCEICKKCYPNRKRPFQHLKA